MPRSATVEAEISIKNSHGQAIVSIIFQHEARVNHNPLMRLPGAPEQATAQTARLAVEAVRMRPHSARLDWSVLSAGSATRAPLTTSLRKAVLLHTVRCVRKQYRGPCHRRVASS